MTRLRRTEALLCGALPPGGAVDLPFPLSIGAALLVVQWTVAATSPSLRAVELLAGGTDNALPAGQQNSG